VETPSPTVSLSKNLFSYQSVLGKGGFGKVWKVELKKNQNKYAMK
jgi:serine/threonine protein kinase